MPPSCPEIWFSSAAWMPGFLRWWIHVEAPLPGPPEGSPGVDVHYVARRGRPLIRVDLCRPGLEAEVFFPFSDWMMDLVGPKASFSVRWVDREEDDEGSCWQVVRGMPTWPWVWTWDMRVGLRETLEVMRPVPLSPIFRVSAGHAPAWRGAG